MKYSNLFLLMLLAGCASQTLDRTPSATKGRYAIEGAIFGKQIVIATGDQFAGAIDSVIWDRKEFINRDDHGRQLQSASSYDGYGECLNPTEAGSGADGSKRSTSSELMGISMSGNVLKTTSRMAYWTAPGTPYPQGCGGRAEFTRAINKTVTSNDILSKEVRIGFSGIENVIEYLVSFKTNEAHTSATFEALTGYMTAEFSSFYIFNPADGALAPIDVGPGEQTLPMILSTPDQRYAMGIYSPELPMTTFPGIGYGRFAFGSQNTMKWNAVYRETNIPAGTYSYRMYVAIGSLAQVQSGLQATYRHFKGGARIEPKPTVPSNSGEKIAIHRFYNFRTGEHFYTATQAEGSSVGYSYEGVAFNLYAKPQTGGTTLYRCIAKIGGFHFGSPDGACEGSRTEGVYGYLRKEGSGAGAGAVLYRSLQRTSGDHLLTTNPTEAKTNGYVVESELGFTAP